LFDFLETKNCILFLIKGEYLSAPGVLYRMKIDSISPNNTRREKYCLLHGLPFLAMRDGSAFPFLITLGMAPPSPNTIAAFPSMHGVRYLN
jgi:hypothetical protein